MEFGIFAPTFAGGDADVRILNRPFYKAIDWPSERNAILEAERLGFDSYWVCDHLSVGEGGSIFENWTTVTSYLNITRRIRVGPMMLCNSFRYPSIVARMAATLDIISGGRLELGIGAGWFRLECEEYGITFPDAKTRVEALREGITIIRKLWQEKRVTFEGKYYRVKDATCYPRPIQEPYPPIVIGGGTKPMIRLAAELGDAYNWFFSPQDFREKLRILEQFCSEAGRNYKEIKKYWLGHVLIFKDGKRVENMFKSWYEMVKSAKTRYDPWVRDSSYEDFKKNVIVGTPEDCIERVRQYQDIGVDCVICNFVDHPSLEGLRLFANEVMPHFK